MDEMEFTEVSLLEILVLVKCSTQAPASASGSLSQGFKGSSKHNHISRYTGPAQELEGGCKPAARPPLGESLDI
jgi:hypothetical protein